MRSPDFLKLWKSIIAALHLLYQVYFQPFSLSETLRQIHPDLNIFSNPFLLRSEFASNPPLRRYASQTWWLTLITPLVATVLVAVPYSFLSKETFNFSLSSLFFVGWVMGLALAQGDSGNLEKWFTRLLYAFTALSLLRLVGSRFLPETIGVLRQILLGSPLAIVAVGVAGGVAGGVAVGVAFGVTYLLGLFRVYFWLPEVLWMLWLSLISRQDAAKVLPLLPPRFDQLICLPLPFLDALLAEAHQTSPIATQQTLNYLTNYTNQQRAVGQAQFLIAVESLHRCVGLQDVIAIADQLAWLPSPPPKIFGSVLPQLLEVSQSVRAADQASSLYEKVELLSLPIHSLASLQKNLSFGRDAALATTFGGIVQNWSQLLQTAKRAYRESAEYRYKIPQVYLASNGLNPDYAKELFKGRQDLFREIERLSLAAQPPVLLLQGSRRTGKTSALKYLPKKVGADLIPLLVDLQGSAGTATTLIGMAESLSQEIIKSAKESRNLILPPPDSAALQADPFLALGRWMERVEQPNKRFLLCLDEFEKLEELVKATGSRVPLNFLRSVMQHRHQWILLFSGSHPLDELKPYWSDYLIGTRTLRLTYLPEVDARELILHPIADFPNIYNPDAVTAILHLTHGQPFLVQLLCSTTVDCLNQEQRKTATVEDVYTAIPKAISTGKGYFYEFWNSTLSPMQRDLLLRLLAGNSPTRKDQPTLQKLIRHEVIDQQTYQIQVPLIQHYIQRNVMFDRDD